MTRKTLDLALLVALALPVACSQGAGDMDFGAGEMAEGEDEDVADEDEEQDEDADEDEDAPVEDEDEDEPVDPTEAETDGEDMDPPDDETDGEDMDPTEGDTDGDTDGEELPPEAEEDFDSTIAPAVWARFTPSGFQPFSVDEPLFNEDYISGRGLQYSNAVSIPGDGSDWVQFRTQTGNSGNASVRISLECDAEDYGRVRAYLFDQEGNQMDVFVCGDEEVSVDLDQPSPNDDFQVEVRAIEDNGEPVLADYTLSINGFCLQGCDYIPYAG